MDYETIEIYLGERLLKSDCLDVHSDSFFPVTLLRLLFHYSEESLRPDSPRNFHGHDFDRWVDNCIAATRLTLRSDGGLTRTERLIDIDSIDFTDCGTVGVTLPDESRWALIDDDTSEPLQAGALNQVDYRLSLDGMFDRHPVDNDSEPYAGFGLLAHLVRVVCGKSGIDPTKVDPRQLSERIFAHFKDELLPLIPSLWNDMEHIEHYCRPRIIRAQ